MTIAWADHGAQSRLERDEEHRHELRAALFGIEVSAQGLSRHRSTMSNGQVDQLAHALVEEVRRVRALLDGRTRTTASFDLADAIAPVLTTAWASGLQVHSAVLGGIEVAGRQDRATQVLVALLDNARHHAPGSPIELRAAVLGDEVELHVEDRGPGMCSRLLEHAFARGVRGDQSNGSGLGLYIVGQLMSDQGGSIAVRPRPNGGTSFVLRFRGAPR